MLRKPPDILITTPESLYLMMTSRAREILTDVEALIVDEIHAVAPTKRGAHMALTLERLERHVAIERRGRGRESRCSGSASRPPSARSSGSPSFLVGPHRECEIVDAGVRKEMDLEIVVPVEDMTDPGATATVRDRSRRRRRAAATRPGARRPRRCRATRRTAQLDLARDLPRAAASSSASTPRRSSSSTTAAAPSGSPSASTR